MRLSLLNEMTCAVGRLLSKNNAAPAIPFSILHGELLIDAKSDDEGAVTFRYWERELGTDTTMRRPAPPGESVTFFRWCFCQSALKTGQ